MADQTAHVELKNEEMLNRLLKKLVRERASGADGSVSFTGFSLFDLSAAFHSFLRFPEAIPDSVARTYVREALVAAAKAERPTVRELKSILSRKTQAYLGRATAQFIVNTSLSVNRNVPSFETHLEESRVVVNPRRALSREGAVRVGTIDELQPPTYVPVHVFVTARSASAALDQAMNDLDLLRGVWNWVLNFGGFRLGFGVDFQPVNQIRRGPIHTVHSVRGTLAEETYWVNQHDGAPLDALDIRGKVANLRSTQRSVGRLLRGHPYSGELKMAFRRYASALDHRSPRVVLLELWSMLELLTATDSGARRHEDTVRRAAFLWPECEFHVAMLTHLKEQRNLLVHRAEVSRDVEILIYQVKRYVEVLMRYHLLSRRRYETMDHACQVLALQTTPEALTRNMQALRVAMRIRKFVLGSERHGGE